MLWSERSLLCPDSCVAILTPRVMVLDMGISRGTWSGGGALVNGISPRVQEPLRARAPAELLAPASTCVEKVTGNLST